MKIGFFSDSKEDMPTPQPARKPAAKKPAPHAAAKPAAKKAPVKRAAPARSTTAKVPAKTAAAKAPVRRAVAPPAPSLSEIARRLRADNFNQPVTVLTAPWEERAVLTVFGAKWNADVRQFLVWGPVRSELTRYVSKPMSWERWIEDEINGHMKAIPKAKVPMKPRAHQSVGVQAIKKAAAAGWRGFAEADSVGLGKGLQASTLIPTPNGFATMGELQVGDEVLSASGKPTRVLAKYLSHAKKFYRITFSDGEHIDADEDHRWLTTNDVERNRVRQNTRTRKRLSEKAQASLQTFLLAAQEKALGVTHRNCYDASLKENEGFITAITRNSLKPVGKVFIRKDKAAALFHPQEVLEQLQKQLIQGNKWGTTAEQESVKTTAEIYATQHIGGFGKYEPPRSNHRILLTTPVEGAEQELSIDPYLFGAWLGDGSAHSGSLTSMDDYIVSRFKAKYDLQRVTLNNEGNKSSNYFFKSFRSDLGKVYSGPHQKKLKKIIPNSYLVASKDQRFELLKGLLDTDGSITQSDPHGGVSFSQKNPELFFQVYSLICSLGFKATWRSREIGINYKGEMRVGVYYDLIFYPNQQVFALPRKAQLLEARLPDFRANSKRHSSRSIAKVEEIAKEGEYYCISVDAPDHLYLCTKSYIPTHNTLTSILGASEVARLKGFTAQNPAKVLIMCPKSVIQHWRNTLQASGIDNLRVVVINYDRSLSLLTQPAKAQAAKKTRTKNNATASQGTPTVRWDIVLADESHKLKGLYSSQRSRAFARIARYNETPDKAPFVIWMSATMGQNPIDLGYMAPLIGQINGKPKLTLDEWGPYLEGEGYAVKPQKVGYAWTTAKMNATEGERKHVAQVQRKDVERISAILFNPKAPSIRRLPTDIAGWPEQQRVPMAVEFDEEQQRLYQEAWLDFRSQMRLLLRGKNPQGALVAMLRFRQKASLLMVEPGLDHITDLLENGLQVAVSCQFLETIDRLRPLVEKAGYRTAEYSGRIQGDEREAERLKFQHGQAKVIFYTVAEAISLHAGEQLADGSVATKAPRANVIIDIRFSGFESLQIEGRTHRDGQNSVTYYMYGESTIQKKLLKSLLQKMKNTSRLSGDTATEALDMVAELIEDAPAPALQLN